jgi:transposase
MLVERFEEPQPLGEVLVFELGRALPKREQAGATDFGPRTHKDRIEEELFAARRDLFSSLDLVFFDTTSVYFEGAGGERLGRFGNSKDHRPDRRQMVVGAVLDNEGQPICSELWPGNTTDVKTLLPVVDRLRGRFGIKDLCIVADRGMISQSTIAELQNLERGCHFILGARMRSVKEIRETVVGDRSLFLEIRGPRERPDDPAPLKVKEVRIEGRRYIVCFNAEQARKDRTDREAILAALEGQLRRGEKSLVGNKGFRKYLKTPGDHFEIDWSKAEDEARFDGLWVLQTDLELPTAEVALKYKELWQVEALFRSLKSVLETRPIYHQRDDTIRGHVFCSFLALVLLKELQRRMVFEADLLESLFALGDQLVDRDAERARRLHHGIEPRTVLSGLHPADVGQVRVDPLGELGLGPSTRLAQLAQIASQRGGGLFRRGVGFFFAALMGPPPPRFRGSRLDRTCHIKHL